MVELKEENVSNKEVYNTIKEEINCDICLGILIKPKQCNKCENTFCEECINSWVNKNKTCPMRCKTFQIVEVPRLLKNMLSRLEFKCETCQELVKYDKLTTDHKESCGKISSSSKCPLCLGNPKLSNSRILDYNTEIVKSYETEILKLRNEMKSYKEIIKIMEQEKGSSNCPNPQTKTALKEVEAFNPSKTFSSGILGSNSSSSNQECYMTWNTVQKKTSFVLSEGNRKIAVKYSSCWNFYYANYVFNKNKSETFTLKVKNLNDADDYSHHYIGFMNDAYLKDCLCLYKKGAYYIHNKGTEFKEGKTVIFSNDKMIMQNKVEKVYKFKINGATGELEISLPNGSIMGSTRLEGKNFQFFVAKCNNGNVEYILGN